jgi:AcrR family transcriptional regulator
MGRRALHTTDALLDAAIELLAADGPAGVTMAGTARAAGAPSGSVYHRFGDRAGLLAKLWARTVGRFEAGFLAAVEEGDVRGAAAHVAGWSRRHPGEALVLLQGASALGSADWPAADRHALEAQNRRLARALRELATRIDVDPDRLALALVDVPYAVVRRQLAGGGRIPRGAEDLVADAAEALLAIPSPGAGQAIARS